MKKIKITLKDKREFEYEDNFYWDVTDRLNDIRNKFIKLGNFIFNKEEISTIEDNDIPDTDGE